MLVLALLLSLLCHIGGTLLLYAFIGTDTDLGTLIPFAAQVFIKHQLYSFVLHSMIIALLLNQCSKLRQKINELLSD